MIVALASFALVLLSAPAVANRFTRRVHPRDWTRWSFAALIVGALAAEAALILFSLPTVLRALGAHALVAACARMTGSLMPGGPVVGWSALSVATLGPLAVAVELLQARRSQHTLSVCVAGVATEQIGDRSVVVIPIGDVLAFTVAGPRPVIVVSWGMKEVMSADQLQARSVARESSPRPPSGVAGRARTRLRFTPDRQAQRGCRALRDRALG